MESVEFKVKILGSCPGDALLRQCMEAVAIRDDNPEMNGRMEWGTGNRIHRRQRRETTINDEEVSNQEPARGTERTIVRDPVTSNRRI